MNRNYFIQRSIISVSALVLTGCMTVGPEYEAPKVETWQDQWIAADTAVLEPGALKDSNWWLDFEDPLLNEMIVDTRTRNFDLAQAEASIAVASAAVRRSRAALFPLGELTGAITRQQQSSASFGADLPFEFEAQTTYSTGANASWEADLFGRVSGGISQAEAALGSRAAIAADTARALIAQTATTYLTLRELDARMAVAEANLERQRDVLKLTQQLRDAGEVSDIDVERQSNLIDTTEASVVALKSARAEALSGLALLTGHTVPDFLEAYPEFQIYEPDAFADLSSFEPLRIGTPEDMLRRRPDIRAAERQLAASTYAVQVATADLYPTLSLTGSASLTALEPGELFSDDALGYSFGPRLSWGIFNLPLTRANIAQAEAETEAAHAAFKSTVLTALTETDAALQTYNFGVEQAAIRKKALGSSGRALELIEIRYREGAESLISLIDAQRQQLAAEDAELQARYEALRRRVDVYRALGG